MNLIMKSNIIKIVIHVLYKVSGMFLSTLINFDSKTCKRLCIVLIQTLPQLQFLYIYSVRTFDLVRQHAFIIILDKHSVYCPNTYSCNSVK